MRPYGDVGRFTTSFYHFTRHISVTILSLSLNAAVATYSTLSCKRYSKALTSAIASHFSLKSGFSGVIGVLGEDDASPLKISEWKMSSELVGNRWGRGVSTCRRCLLSSTYTTGVTVVVVVTVLRVGVPSAEVYVVVSRVTCGLSVGRKLGKRRRPDDMHKRLPSLSKKAYQLEREEKKEGRVRI